LSSPLLEAALRASLEQIPRAAFILDGRGSVVMANGLGQGELACPNPFLRAALFTALSACDGPSPFKSTPLQASGCAPLYLVVAAPKDKLAVLLDHFSQEAKLTARQTDVLALLVLGESNKGIASRLQCVERTIELHVTAVLRKAHVDSRAALIARFFQSR